MTVIRVPKTPGKAYNPQRPAGVLLQSQLRHLEWAVRPAGARTEKAFRIKPATTEAEAAARIAKLTEKLHDQATSPGDVMPPTPVPAARASARTKAKSKSKPQPKTTSQSQRPSRRRTSR